MVNCRENFNEFPPVQGQLQVGNQEVLNSEGFGTVDAISVVKGIKKKLRFRMSFMSHTYSKIWSLFLEHERKDIE